MSDSDCSTTTTRPILWQTFLIELVRARQVLYDKSHRSYSDTRGAKFNTWKDVVEELKSAGFQTLDGIVPMIDVDTITAQWINIRDSYRKWQKADEIARRSGAAARNLPKKYKYADQMAWLADFNKPTCSTTSSVTSTARKPAVAATSTAELSLFEPPIADEEIVIETTETPAPAEETVVSATTTPPTHIPITTTPPTITTATTLSSRNKRARTELSSPTYNMETAMREAQRSIDTIAQAAAKTPTTRMQDDIFGELIAAQLKSIPESHRKDFTKLKIQRMLYELKHPDHQSADFMTM